MTAADARNALARIVLDSDLIPEGSRGVALVSGGGDSAALAAGLVGLIGADAVLLLHLNYALRDDSDRDEEVCRELCRALGAELVTERHHLGTGNVQAEARDARYAAAERIRRSRGLDWIATGHTR